MAEPEKQGTRGGGNSLNELPCVSMIAVFERMLASLEARARPIQEEIQVVQETLAKLRADKVLEDRRRQLASRRQTQQN